MSGATPRSCGTFLATDIADYFLEDQVTVELLRELFVHCAKSYSSQDLVIGVDETIELERKNDETIISGPGHIAHAYYEATQLMCTVLVTSLVWENFKTSSNGGGVKVWTPKSPNRSDFEWFAQGVTGMSTSQVTALFSAVSGSHMRSLAVAHEALLEHKTPSVPSMLLQVEERMGNKLDQNDLEYVRQYVISCILDKSKSKVPVDIEVSSDEASAVPPALMCLAFNVKNLMSRHIRFFCCLVRSPSTPIRISSWSLWQRRMMDSTRVWGCLWCPAKPICASHPKKKEA
jgi:hypothetical protein